MITSRVYLEISDQYSIAALSKDFLNPYISDNFKA